MSEAIDPLLPTRPIRRLPMRLAATLALSALTLMAAPPAAAAVNKEDRKLCTEAKPDDPASLLKCMQSLNERLSEIEDEPEEIEEPDDTDERIAALETELRAARQEAAAATEAARMATEQAAAANAKINAMADSQDASDAADAIDKPEKDQPNRVTAPFTVVDASGNPILTVRSDQGDAELTVGALNGKHARLLAGNEGVRVSATDGEKAVVMTVSATAATVHAIDGGKGTVAIGHTPDGFSGVRMDQDAGTVFNVGMDGQKGPALRAFKDGKVVAAIGSNADTGGSGAVILGDGAATAVSLLSKEGAQGTVAVFAGGEFPVAEMRGPESAFVVVGDGGRALAALSRSTNSNGGNITLMSPGGEGVVSAGAATDGGGEVCVNRQDGKTHCLGVGLPLR